MNHLYISKKLSNAMDNETTCGRCGILGTITKAGHCLDACQCCGGLIFREEPIIDKERYINWRKREGN